MLETCARDVCPRVARTDCRQWLTEATDAQPSILIVAHEIHGHNDVRDVRGVRATIDETVVVEEADTTPLLIDPGRHRIRLERADEPSIEQNVEIREGEKNHVVDFYWRATAAAVTPSVTRPVPASMLVTSGLAIAAAAMGAAFEGVGLSERQRLGSTCQPTLTCKQSDVDTARSFTRVGDISLGVASLFAVSTLILYIVRPTVEAPAAPADSWLLAPVRGGFVGGLRLNL